MSHDDLLPFVLTIFIKLFIYNLEQIIWGGGGGGNRGLDRGQYYRSRPMFVSFLGCVRLFRIGAGMVSGDQSLYKLDKHSWLDWF